MKLKVIATSNKYHKRLSSNELIVSDKRFVVERKYRCPDCHCLLFTQEFVASVRKRSDKQFKKDKNFYTPKKLRRKK